MATRKNDLRTLADVADKFSRQAGITWANPTLENVDKSIDLWNELINLAPKTLKMEKLYQEVSHE